MQLQVMLRIESNDLNGTIAKGVFCNQMKSVFGEVLVDDMLTESGEKIDAVFGYVSVAARIVLSPEMIGTTNTLLDVIGKQAVAIYKGK